MIGFKSNFKLMIYHIYMTNNNNKSLMEEQVIM